ncbi:MAG TPA: hypothetical protein VGW10_07320, partial [Solirubrobacteraceae bacterium]|nr:hypothetical protein [Solirubrobacteraceae bacterium]
VKAVRFMVNGRRIRVDRRAPFRRTVTLTRKQARGKVRLTALITLNDNSRTALRRTLKSRLSR